ncbi:hypothetical protein Tco_0305364 [Tanacetum coccineum]
MWILLQGKRMTIRLDSLGIRGHEETCNLMIYQEQEKEMWVVMDGMDGLYYVCEIWKMKKPTTTSPRHGEHLEIINQAQSLRHLETLPSCKLETSGPTCSYLS